MINIIKEEAVYIEDRTPIKKAKWFSKAPDEWLRHVIAIHFDPDSGSEYWLNRERELGIDARKEIVSINKLN
ncbi:MAG: hypothetical protein ACUZ8O_02535, partial [Candidatus Anammoxibacter sp.]